MLLNFHRGFEQIDAGRRRGTSEGIGRVAVPVKKGSRGITRERGKDLLGGQSCGQREISAGEAFR